jgi:hypothetical protein
MIGEDQVNTIILKRQLVSSKIQDDIGLTGDVNVDKPRDIGLTCSDI